MVHCHTNHVNMNRVDIPPLLCDCQNMDSKDAFIRPPEKISTPYQDVTSQPLWDFDKDFASAEWPPMRFCTDEECSRLSGVPERSLLTLQTAEVIHSTKSSAGAGASRRVWHVAHVAAAATVECLKRATGIDYPTAAKITFQASLFARVAFFHYLNLGKIGKLDQFQADLILSHNSLLFLEVSKTLRAIEPAFRECAVGNIIAFAGIEDGESKSADLNNARQQQGLIDALSNSRFRVVINLKNVFEQFERDARKMRT